MARGTTHAAGPMHGGPRCRVGTCCCQASGHATALLQSHALFWLRLQLAARTTVVPGPAWGRPMHEGPRRCHAAATPLRPPPLAGAGLLSWPCCFASAGLHLHCVSQQPPAAEPVGRHLRRARPRLHGGIIRRACGPALHRRWAAARQLLSCCCHALAAACQATRVQMCGSAFQYAALTQAAPWWLLAGGPRLPAGEGALRLTPFPDKRPLLRAGFADRGALLAQEGLTYYWLHRMYRDWWTRRACTGPEAQQLPAGWCEPAAGLGNSPGDPAHSSTRGTSVPSPQPCRQSIVCHTISEHAAATACQSLQPARVHTPAGCAAAAPQGGGSHPDA